MLVGIDVKPLTGRPTGVGRVVAGVLEGLARLEDVDVQVRRLAPRAGARTLPWVQLGLPWRARGADVLHCPFYYRPLVAPCPVVVVIHDLLPVTHPHWFPRRGRHPFAELMLWSARHAAAVITPSRAVLQQLIEVVGPLGLRGRAIPHGVDDGSFRPRAEDEVATVRERLAIGSPYLLAVGSLQPRRGIGTALAALELLLGSWPELRLVVAGQEEKRWGRVPEHLGRQVLFTGYLPEDELPPLMSGAAAMLSLSRGEGFDLPLLEALACGTPVVASDIDVHREHFAEWASLVPVGDAEAVAVAADSVLRSPPSPEDRARQASTVHARFRWEDSARAHVEVWRRVARARERR